jgi:hypothetical protein
MSADQSSDVDGCAPDSEDRIQDFFARHGGPAARGRAGAETVAGMSGWTEVYAADGHVLRCEWARFGSKQEMQYTEKPPQA